jgi:hypothetical protein
MTVRGRRLMRSVFGVHNVLMHDRMRCILMQRRVSGALMHRRVHGALLGAAVRRRMMLGGRLLVVVRIVCCVIVRNVHGTEMLRVPFVCSPKTLGKTIFHANSLS